MRTTLRIAVLLALVICFVQPASSQITTAQRREIRSISATLGQVKAALRKDDRATAEEKLKEAESAFATLREESGLEESATVFKSLVKLLSDRKADLGQGDAAAGMQPGRQPVNSGAVDPAAATKTSFVRDVVPILTGKCLRCHTGNRARGGLDLSTFAAMKVGGDGGALLVRGNPGDSQLIERAVTDDFDLRMPKGGQLFDDEIAVLTKWVADGAVFDGDNESTPLRGLSRSKANPGKVVIPKPKGTETVSFSKDIGPMFNRICLSCHQGNNPSGGLSLVSFNDLMVGGDSGAVIIPGDAENSRLFRLVGGLELPKMPGDQSRIRRSEYAALKTWFEEGNVFDGPDPAAAILSYIETPERIAARERANRSAAEWKSARKANTAAQWKRAMPLIDPQFAESGSVFAAGNAANLAALAQVAADQRTAVESAFGKLDGADRGLSLFVIDSSYGHRELGRSLASLDSSAPFHAYASADTETLYAAVDSSSTTADSLSVEDRVRAAVTSAYFEAKGAGIPRWVSEGAGRAFVVTADKLPIARAWRGQAARAIGPLAPVDVTEDASYEASDTGVAGYVIVDSMIDSGGRQRFAKFADALAAGNNVDQAMRRVYGQSAGDLGRAVKSLR